MDHNNYYFVGGGNAGGFGIILTDDYQDKYELILSLLNSKVLEFYLKNTSTPFQRGFYSYGKRFIHKLPIIIPSDQDALILNDLTKKQLRLAKQGQDSIENENLINEIIFKIYNISDKEREIIEKTIES